MSDEIEDREVHLCRVGTDELLKALKDSHARNVPRPIVPVSAKLKMIGTKE